MPSMRYTTQFLLSALAAEQFPRTNGAGDRLPGSLKCRQSSLLNALVGEKAAKVSQTPGRTRAINFFALLDPRQQRKLVFADLPGYGYAKISKSISAEWPKFIDPYLAERQTLKLCICLVDSNISPQPNDGKLSIGCVMLAANFWLSLPRPIGSAATRAQEIFSRSKIAFDLTKFFPSRQKPEPVLRNSGTASRPQARPNQPVLSCYLPTSAASF